MSVLKIKKPDGTWEIISSNNSIEVDTTLTQSGKPADAKTVGDKIGNLNSLTTTEKTNLVSAINEIASKNISSIEIDTTLTENGKAADAKATGDALAEKISFINEQSLTDEQKLIVQKNINLNKSLSIYTVDIAAADNTEITVSNDNITPWDTNVGVGGVLLTTDGKLFNITAVTSTDNTYSYTAELIMALKEENTTIPSYDLTTDFSLPVIPEDGSHIVATKAITTGVENIASKLWKDLAAGPCQVKFQISVEGNTLNCSRVITPNYNTEYNAYEINIPTRWNQTYGFVCLQFAKTSNMIYIYGWYDKIDADLLEIPSMDDIISVPEYTENDYGKYLTVNADGPFWNPLTVSEDGTVSTTTQPDWNQNNSGATDYIKNRPMYEDGEEVEIPILTDIAIPFENTNGNIWGYIADTPPLYPEPGVNYKIIIDGQVYNYTCKYDKNILADDGSYCYSWGAPMLEILYYIQGILPTISEPISIVMLEDGTTTIMVFNSETAPSTLSVSKIVKVKEETILDDTFTFSRSGEGDDTGFVSFLPTIDNLLPETSYQVLIGDTEYILSTAYANGEFDPSPLGDPLGYHYGDDNTMIMLGPSISMVGYADTTTSTDITSVEKTVKITGYVSGIKKLDAKYLPNKIVTATSSSSSTTGSTLPTVTTADNDKVLMVVNGVWAAAAITSGDEVAY